MSCMTPSTCAFASVAVSNSSTVKSTSSASARCAMSCLLPRKTGRPGRELAASAIQMSGPMPAGSPLVMRIAGDRRLIGTRDPRSDRPSACAGL